MTREEAIKILADLTDNPFLHTWEEQNKALHMAIEALQFVEHFDLLKEFQSLQEVVQCKNCKYRETDDCPMYWVEWSIFEDCDGYTDDKYIVHDYTTDDGYCNYGERKES